MDGLKEKERREIGLESLALGAGTEHCLLVSSMLPLTYCFLENSVPQTYDCFSHADCSRDCDNL